MRTHKTTLVVYERKKTATKIKNCLGRSEAKIQWPSSEENFTSIFEKVKVGEKFNPIENLFTKIEDSKALSLEKQFAGN